MRFEIGSCFVIVPETVGRSVFRLRATIQTEPTHLGRGERCRCYPITVSVDLARVLCSCAASGTGEKWASEVVFGSFLQRERRRSGWAPDTEVAQNVFRTRRGN